MTERGGDSESENEGREDGAAAGDGQTKIRRELPRQGDSTEETEPGLGARPTRARPE